ncbi:hypothetical protein JCM11251_004126 [Rhodosporidiobolus azoricus]
MPVSPPSASQQIANGDAVGGWAAPIAFFADTYERCWGKANGALTDGIPHLADLTDQRLDTTPHLWREDWRNSWDWVASWLDGKRQRDAGALVLCGQPDIGKSRNLRALLLALLERRVFTVFTDPTSPSVTVFCDTGAYSLPWSAFVALRIVGSGVLLVDSAAGNCEPASHFSQGAGNLLTVFAMFSNPRLLSLIPELFRRPYFWVQEPWSQEEVLDLLHLRSTFEDSSAFESIQRRPLATLRAPSYAPVSSAARVLTWTDRHDDLAEEGLPPNGILHRATSTPHSPLTPSSPYKASLPQPDQRSVASSSSPPSSHSSTSSATGIPGASRSRIDLVLSNKQMHPLEVLHHAGPNIRMIVEPPPRRPVHPLEQIYGSAVMRDLFANAGAILKAAASGSIDVHRKGFSKIFSVVPKRGADQPSLVGPEFEIRILTATQRNLVRSLLHRRIGAEQSALLRSSTYCPSLRGLYYENDVLRYTLALPRLPLRVLISDPIDPLARNVLYRMPDRFPTFDAVAVLDGDFDRPLVVFFRIALAQPRALINKGFSRIEAVLPMDAELLFVWITPSEALGKSLRHKDSPVLPDLRSSTSSARELVPVFFRGIAVLKPEQLERH